MENQSIPMKITVKSVLDIIFRNKRIIILTFILCMFVTFIILQFMTPVYDSNVKMLIRGVSTVTSDLYDPINTRSIQATQVEIVRSEPVLRRAALALDLQNRPFDYEKNYCSSLKKYYIDYRVKKTEKELTGLSPEELADVKLNAAIGDLKGRLTTKVIPGTDIFVINVTAFTPEEAIETANVISRSYTMFDQIQQLAEVRLRYGEFHPMVIQLQDNIREATIKLSGKALPDMEAMGTASVKIIEQATSSGLAVTQPKKILLAGAFFISIAISLGLALVIGLFDRTIKTPQDIADNLDIPCIGSIPEKQRNDKYLITDESPDTRYYNFYEELCEQLVVFLSTQGIKTAVITSPSYNKNHKFIVPNLGYFLSRIMGKKILLIDANFNNPTLKKIYSISGDKGLDINVSLDVVSEHMYKTDKGMDVLPAKTTTEKPSTVLEKINFKNSIDRMKDEYDAVLIDATSVNNLKDASFISEYSDGTIIIIDEGKLKGQMLKNSLPRLKRNDAVIIGGILNNRTFPIPEVIYKYFKFLID